MSYLAAVGEIKDETGMASTALAHAVDYQGSSVAFAQLLSGMVRAGLIEREVRGKRTYQIALAGSAAVARVMPGRKRARRLTASRARRSGSASPGRRGHEVPSGSTGARSFVVPVKETADFDYDELARRLLFQVVQRLADRPAPAAGELAAEPAGQGVRT
jgi:hypothetical protein